MGLNYPSCQQPPRPPIPGGAGLGPSSAPSILTSLVYHVDRIANPDTSTNHGTIENIRRGKEILAYVARYGDNNTEALRPVVFGKALAQGLKSPNERRRPHVRPVQDSRGFFEQVMR